MNKVLVIAVHPDDETLGCGGTLLRHKDEGDEIYWLIVTTNDKKYSPERNAHRDEMVRKATALYGFDGVFEAGLPTTLLDTLDVNTLVEQINKVYNEVKPNIVYMNFIYDVHSDHKSAFEAAYTCTRSFRKPFIEKIYMIEALSETEFAPAISSSSFCPNVYVDITNYIDKKLEIMKLYDTEIMDEPLPRSLSSIKALARLRGSRAGVMYAEAFQLLYEKR